MTLPSILCGTTSSSNVVLFPRPRIHDLRCPGIGSGLNGEITSALSRAVRQRTTPDSDVDLFPGPWTSVDEDLGLLCSICSQLDKLDTNINKATSALAQVVEERCAYLTQLNLHRDPIQRLPVELVTAIFNLCLPPLPCLDVFAGKHIRQDQIPVRPMQYFLGSICRYWRKIIWSTPLLWNTVLLRLSACTTMAQCDLVAEALRRSNCLPLDVAMSYEGSFQNSDAPAIKRMIDTLCWYASRIRILHLRLLGSHILRFGKNGIKPSGDYNIDASTSILEKLSIDVLDRDSVGPGYYTSRFKIEGQQPMPTQVCFVGILPNSIGVHWGHVTCIEAEAVETHDALKLLYLAPQLQKLKIGIIQYQKAFSLESITHSSLKVLEIIPSNATSCKFLDLLTCPVLEELFSYYSFNMVQEFLKRSACRLQKLRLEMSLSNFEHVNLPQLLRLTPLLTHLTLDNVGIPKELLTGCGKTPYFGQSESETGSFLPHLRSFTSNGVGYHQFHWSQIPSLLRSLSVSEVKINLAVEPHLKNIQHVMDRKILVETLELVKNKKVVLKVRDSRGNDLIQQSKQVYKII